MRRSWVVLLEVASDEAVGLEVETVEALLAQLADRYPSALHAPDRYALQFLVEADGPDGALADGVSLWRRAARAVGLPDDGVVRAEVKTPAELAAECSDEGDAPSVPTDERALVAAYDATRRMLHSHAPREVVSVLRALVRQLGGTLLPPRPSDPRALDLDVSLGFGPPMVAAAEPHSIDRLCLEEALPAVAEDARRIVDLLLAASASESDDVARSDRSARADSAPLADSDRP